MAFWNKKNREQTGASHKPPFRSPPSSALEAPQAWELTDAEKSFQGIVRSSFRTRAFKNLSKPDSPQEYLEADYLPGLQQWRVRACIVGEGTALAAIFQQPAKSNEVATATQKSRTILQTTSVVEVLQKLSLYEFGTDTTSKFALREVIDEDLMDSHFIDFAHAEGIIFDANGHPSLTQNGKPMRDGEFPEQEIKAAEDYDFLEKQDRRNPVIIRSSELSGIFQPHGKLEGFDYFSKLVQAEAHVKIALQRISGVIQSFYEQREDQAVTLKVWNTPYSYAPPIELSSAEILPALSSGQEFSSGHQDIENALQDAALTFKIFHAAYAVSYYQNIEMDARQAETLGTFLTEAEAALAGQDFDDQKKDSIRSFIMKKRTLAEFATDFQNWKTSVESIHHALSVQAQNIIGASQQKNSGTPKRTAIPQSSQFSPN